MPEYRDTVGPATIGSGGDIKQVDSLTGVSASDFFGIAMAGNSMLMSDGNNLGFLATHKKSGKIKTVIQGNSIALASGFSAANLYNERSEHVYADILLGGFFEFPLITPVNATVTRSDKYACYGYSGGTLSQIIGDLPLEHFQPLRDVGFVPDLVIGMALLENDVPGGNYENMVENLQKWISINRAQWPGVKLIIATPRPSKFYASTASKRSYTQITDYIKTLANGIDIAIYEPGKDYQDQNDPSQAQRFNVLATVASNVVTLDGSETRRLYPGDLIVDSDHAITACNLTTRTYGITNLSGGNLSNVTTATILPVFPFHDDGPHPQGNATGLNAHRLADAVKSLYPNVSPQVFTCGANQSMLGSTAVTGGTVPTGMSVEGSFNALTCVYQALNPGVRQIVSTIPANTLRQGVNFIQLCDDSTTVPKGTNRFQCMMVAEIESGAEYVKSIRLRYGYRDNGSGAGTYFISIAGSTNSQFAKPINGEEVAIITPMIYSAGVGSHIDRIQLQGSIEVVDNCPADAVVSWKIKRYAILCPDGLTGRVTLAAGTATVNMGTYVRANSKITLNRITAGGTVGFLTVSAKTAGTSFVITSSNAADTSIVEYTIES